MKALRMAYLLFMIILHLYSDPCFGQNSMGDDAARPRSATGMKCTKCIFGTKARESICSDCTRDGDKPFTCRRCNIGPTSAQPFLCRRCINTNPDINSCDGVGMQIDNNASREQRLAEIRRLLVEKFTFKKNIDLKLGNYQHFSVNQLNNKINYFKNKECGEWLD